MSRQSTTMQDTQRGTAWPLLAALAWLAFTMGLRPLAVPDEGRYAGVAWAMVTHGDWLVPRLNGLPYFHKPPLYYWITAAAMQLFGPVEWAARIAPLLGASTAATAVYLFARRWWDERFARRALLALCTQVLVFVGAQYANLDMLVAGCITATVLAFADAALSLEQGRAARWQLAAGYLFAALGVLAKGLIGVVLPGMVLVIWIALRRRPRVVLALLWWPGLLLFALVAAPWFVLMQREFAEFAHYFFYVQHFARYAEGGFNNQRPAYFYPLVLLALAFPWSLWLLSGLRRRLAADAPEPGLRSLLWVWLAAITLFFSLPQSKLVGYILPVTAPLALLAAGALQGRREIAWRATAACAAVLCAGAVAYAALHPVKSSLELRLALRAAKPGDRVVFVEHYWFDVPVYGRLRSPVAVVAGWGEPGFDGRDNWHKELADAGYFDPAVAHQVLLTPERAQLALCGPATSWVLGNEKALARYPLLAQAPVLARHGPDFVWRVPGLRAGEKRPGCAQPAGADPAP
jgi:4-amino-4-deoxy-L-arabinose transferase-like glycosyltransferase